MLDDNNVLNQRDPGGALRVAADLYRQAGHVIRLAHTAHDGRPLTNIVIAGMGGSALAADMVKTLLATELSIPLEVVKGYQLPHYVDSSTLVIASSHSGNTEETVSCLEQAIERGAQIAITAAGGKLKDAADQRDIMYAPIPHDTQPRMAMIYGLRALLTILHAYDLIDTKYLDEIASMSNWLREESDAWTRDMPVERNYAKQLALVSVGKTPIIYGGSLTAPVAYKWKISWNENAKNTAFWNVIPEFNHNEFIGWTSHPVEKPFVIFDLVSSFEHPQILKRFEVSDRLLSGQRPKATTIRLAGDTLLKQLLWGCILADFVSIYVAILNNIDPTRVDLIEKFKNELA